LDIQHHSAILDLWSILSRSLSGDLLSQTLNSNVEQLNPYVELLGQGALLEVVKLELEWSVEDLNVHL
jgi:hypothetical protein